MLVNVGSGDRYVTGWYNVDHEGSPHRKDAVVDITKKLPWERESLLHVYLGHVLEHVTFGQAKIFLKRLRPLVDPKGQILVVGPDIKIASEMEKAGTLNVTMNELKHGGHRWPGDEHRWECTSEKVIELLTETGWRDIQPISINDVATFWPVADRGPQWQCAVTARS